MVSAFPLPKRPGISPVGAMAFLITILANKSNHFGLSHDVEAVRLGLGGQGAQIRHCDPLEAASYTDVAIHLEVPIYGWMPWAATNVLVVNPEWYVAAWDPYLPRFDRVVFKDGVSRDVFVKRGLVTEAQAVVIPWATPAASGKAPTPAKEQRAGFLWMLGASKSKRAYVPTIVAAWKPDYPELVITTTTALDLSGVSVGPNIHVKVGDLDAPTRETLLRTYKGHVCASRAEGFGYTAAEAELAGAFTILNALPCYVQDHAKSEGVVVLPSNIQAYPFDEGLPAAQLEDTLDLAMDAFAAWGPKEAKARQAAAAARWTRFKAAWSEQLAAARAGIPKRPMTLAHLPPRLEREDCPPISVVTLLYNRKAFFDLACHNVMITDYPKNKIEWIIVDDSDDPMEQASDRVMAVAAKSDPVRIVYVPLAKKTPVSEKRNIGVRKATAEIVLMMDDDDHYPETSFRRRVAWLTQHPWKPRAAAATTIACYDLKKGTSSVNVPPLDIPLGQRISEATLTFWRSWWEERPFSSDTVVGEAEDFLSGREGDLLELPAQQTIVAFSHGRNVSSRRVPSDPDAAPSCFWGFPKEFLIFIHKLAGITVVSK